MRASSALSNMRIMVGLKERFVRVHDQFWEWVFELPEPTLWAVFWIALGTLLCVWTLALLYFIGQALRWVGKA